jgi:hypothetical protein
MFLLSFVLLSVLLLPFFLLLGFDDSPESPFCMWFE